MPTQEYNCESDGPFDVTLSFSEDVPRCKDCPTCGLDSRHVLRAPAVKFARTWNEQANEAQRDPYTQAQAQSWNNYNEQRELGVRVEKPNEESLQIAATAIAHEESNPRPSAHQQQMAYTKKVLKKNKSA